jgi:nicotinamidase-related amidase
MRDADQFPDADAEAAPEASADADTDADPDPDPDADAAGDRTIDLPARYYRHVPDPDAPNDETGLRHEERPLPLPARRTALVLVDCWNDHSNDGVLDRTRDVMDEHLVPTVAAVREAGLPVVHCPSPAVAPNYPDRRVDSAAGANDDADAPDWPPAAVRERRGEAAFLAKREDEAAREARHDAWPPWDAIYGPLEPAVDEPVVATGAELREWCRRTGRWCLLYAGFHANVCVEHRDYGVRAMADRGYGIVLLRDCTTGIESHDTLEGMWHTRTAIRNVEVQVGWSATGAALRDALPPAGGADGAWGAGAESGQGL